MREILFRGKRLDNGEWVQGFFNKWSVYDESENNYHHYIQPLDENGRLDIIHRVHPVTVGQYTGLTDINGTKIFEGDIVIVTTTNIDEEDGYGIIDWHEDTARYIVDLPNLLVDFDNLYSKEVEIIGNLYDNPELIGGADNG